MINIRGTLFWRYVAMPKPRSPMVLIDWDTGNIRGHVNFKLLGVFG